MVMLAGIVLALIFKPDFRNDILVSASESSDNETTIFGVIKIKGAIIVVLFGSLVGLTIYFGNLENSDRAEIQPRSAESWIPLDVETLMPKTVEFRTGADSVVISKRSNLLQSGLGIDSELHLLNKQGEPIFGRLDENDLMQAGYFNGLSYKGSETIRYLIDLNDRSVDVDWHTGNYEDLPYQINIDFVTGRTNYHLIDTESGERSTEYSSLDKGSRKTFIKRQNNYVYFYRNVASDLQADSTRDNYALFEIMRFELK